MTNNQLTDAQISNATLIRLIRWADEHNSHYVAAALRELQERRKAAMDSEPVAEVLSSRPGNDTSTIDRALPVGTTLYRHAQPAPKRDQVRNEHAEWSQATFGDVGPVGPLKHLSKEALEAAAEPGDLSEWADMQFLLWDAQQRAGITDEQITQAMIEKLAVNKQREWPEPKDGEPRLHIKEQMAPVTQQEPIAWLNDAYLARGVVDGEAGSEDAGPGYIPVYREAGPQPAPVVPEALQSLRTIVADPRRLPRRKEWIGGQQYSFVLLEEVEAIVEYACRAATLQAGNSPVIGIDPASGPDRTVEVRYVAPPGYVMVPKEPTAEMQSAGASAIRIETTAVNKLWTGNAVYRAMLAAAPQEANHG